jgi:hypothetical protein
LCQARIIDSSGEGDSGKVQSLEKFHETIGVVGLYREINSDNKIENNTV